MDILLNAQGEVLRLCLWNWCRSRQHSQQLLCFIKIFEKGEGVAHPVELMPSHAQDSRFKHQHHIGAHGQHPGNSIDGGWCDVLGSPLCHSSLCLNEKMKRLDPGIDTELMPLYHSQEKVLENGNLGLCVAWVHVP